MGCDIHMYLEFSERDRWVSFGGRINPGRNYRLFGLIAGVRCGGALFAKRGLPEKLGHKAEHDSRLLVDDQFADEEDFCSRERAESWVASGTSTWSREDKSAVTHPDWHSHTWLTPAEFRQVLDAPDGSDDPWRASPEWWAALAALEELERRAGQARVVIWFDN